MKRAYAILQSVHLTLPHTSSRFAHVQFFSSLSDALNRGRPAAASWKTSQTSSDEGLPVPYSHSLPSRHIQDSSPCRAAPEIPGCLQGKKTKKKKTKKKEKEKKKKGSVEMNVFQSQSSLTTNHRHQYGDQQSDQNSDIPFRHTHSSRSPISTFLPSDNMASSHDKVSPAAKYPPGAKAEDLLYDVDSGDENVYNPRLKHQRQRSQKPRFEPSEEQQHIINLAKTHNVVVSARPGSGKTATAEAIVSSVAQGERVAILTYSKRLTVETKARLGSKYKHVNIWTFHGMACRLFGESIYTDAMLLKKRNDLINKRIPLPQLDIEPFDVIILDEFQDCTEILFWLICVFIQANQIARGEKPARIVILGDERQAIYRFRGADARYLSLAPELFGPLAGGLPWARASLSKSFRMSHQTVNFINHALLGGEPYIVGSKEGPLPIVLHSKIFNEKAIAQKLFALIKKYGAQNTAILSPSVRGKELVAALTNHLGEHYGVPIAVSTNDEAPLDDRVIEGKLSVSTIHQFKGSERDLVIVMNMANQSYFNYFARDAPDDRCTNEQFVAFTRARERLVVLYEHQKDLLAFVEPESVLETALWDHTYDIPPHEHHLKRGPKPGNRAIKSGLVLPSRTSVSDTIRHLQDEHIQRIISKYLDVIVLKEAGSHHEEINIPVVVPSRWTIQRSHTPTPDTAVSSQPLTVTSTPVPFYPQREWDFHETVSDLNGLVVVAAAEYIMLKTLSTLELENPTKEDEIRQLNSQLTKEDVVWLCQRACKYEAQRSNYKARLLQMKDHTYDWIEPSAINTAARRLIDEIRQSPNHAFLGFEIDITKRDYMLDSEQTSLEGFADIISVDTSQGLSHVGVYDFGKQITPLAPQFDACRRCLWEVKFTHSLGNEHVLQAAMYAHMIYLQTGHLPESTILFNVRTGEKWEIRENNSSNEQGKDSLTSFMEDLIRTKYTSRGTVDDERFVRECERNRGNAMEAFAEVADWTDEFEGESDELDIQDEDFDSGKTQIIDEDMEDVGTMGIWGSRDHFRF